MLHRFLRLYYIQGDVNCLANLNKIVNFVLIAFDIRYNKFYYHYNNNNTIQVVVNALFVTIILID